MLAHAHIIIYTRTHTHAHTHIYTYISMHNMIYHHVLFTYITRGNASAIPNIRPCTAGENVIMHFFFTVHADTNTQTLLQWRCKRAVSSRVV
jgi:hypothetical protein